MTGAELEAIEALAARTSPGPWASVLCGEGVHIEDAEGQVVARQLATEADGFFIISAKTFVPAMIADLRSARKRLAAIEALAEKWLKEAVDRNDECSPTIAAFTHDIQQAVRGDD